MAKRDDAAEVVFKVLGLVCIFLIQVGIVALAWNAAVVPLAGLPRAGFVESAGLVVLSYSLRRPW